MSLTGEAQGRTSNAPSIAAANDNARTPDVLNADEVAAFLRCNRKTVYEAVARRQIPHQKLGRRVLFSRAALLEWLACKGSSER